MKSKYFTTIVVEGPDGVGKTTLCNHLRDDLKFKYMIQHRGEMSNFVYSEKFNRTMTCTERHFPILYIYLYADKSILKERINIRAEKEHWTYNDTIKELNKVNDVDLFEKYYKAMKNDYNVIRIDTSNIDTEETFKKALKLIDKFNNNMEIDEKETAWCEMYRQACKQYNLDFKVVDNQMFINNRMVMSESTLQNGVYETFSDKNYPDNLLYSTAYTQNYRTTTKEYDFAYVINSKVHRRPEILKYFEKFLSFGMSVLTSEYIKTSNSIFDKSDKMIAMPRTFGDKFIDELSKAKATVYCARDLAYLKLQTARLYEATLANQVVFVDKDSDINNEILTNIYGNTTYDNFKLKSLLYVNEKTIFQVFEYVFAHKDLVSLILKKQKDYYEKLKSNLPGKF